jgi:protoheme IX farnesyltransferase
MPVLVGLAGAPYAAAAVLLAGAMIWVAAAFARERSVVNARRLFIFSILYLALLWIALVVDRLWL